MTNIFEDVKSTSTKSLANENPIELSFEISSSLKVFNNFIPIPLCLPKIIEAENNAGSLNDEQLLMILNQARNQGILNVWLLDQLLLN